jgi:signal transduction histidine kinase
MELLIAGIAELFDTSGFPARWNCGNWSPLHGWSHILADLAIAAAYSVIPFALAAYWWFKRNEMAFPRLFWLFAAFIFSCGATHVMEAVIFYHPAYRFAALLKAVTAVASWATVFALFRIAPAALKLPGLSRANDELQLQLQNTRRAEEALARSNQDLESFTGLVTHDLRNPLHSALLRSEIAREAMDRGDAALAASQLRLAMESMYQMEALVRELHAEAVLRHHTTEMGMLPLSTVISAARTNLAPLISSSGARIVLGSLPEVRASRTMLIQLFINLFENSIKYRSDESPLIEITASAQAGHAVIRVSDNCIGIPPHERERVFQSGVRGSQTASLPGSGLGLSFCQGIMQAHGGSITVVDNTGTGAAFELRFPDPANHGDGVSLAKD